MCNCTLAIISFLTPWISWRSLQYCFNKKKNNIRWGNFNTVRSLNNIQFLQEIKGSGNQATLTVVKLNCYNKNTEPSCYALPNWHNQNLKNLTVGNIISQSSYWTCVSSTCNVTRHGAALVAVCLTANNNWVTNSKENCETVNGLKVQQLVKQRQLSTALYIAEYQAQWIWT